MPIVAHSLQFGDIVKAVATVLLATGLFSWGMWSAARSSQHAERDAPYRRRTQLRLGTLYLVILVVGVAAVLIGHQQKITLAGVPICLLMGWWLVRNGRNVTVPPA